MNGNSPERKVGQNDNRSSHYFFARYWAEALAEQATDTGLATKFKPIAKELAENEKTILDELKAVEGQPVDLGGYYMTDPVKTAAIMRPSKTLNAIIG